jgi:alpha-galactosidase/6-phospho-beta-glucosidase family protein
VDGSNQARGGQIRTLFLLAKNILGPHTAAELDMRQIRPTVDDLLNAHGDWLPEWTRAAVRNGT